MKHFKEGHARRSIRLRTKILLVCMSLVILCATLWAVLEKGVEAQIEEIYYNKTHALLRSECARLLMQVDEISNSLTSLCLNEGFNQIMEEYLRGKNDSPSVGQLSAVTTLLEEWLGKNSLIQASFIHTSKGDFFQLSRGIRKDFVFENTSVYRLMQEKPKQSLLFGDCGANEFYNIPGTVIPMVLRYRQCDTQETIVLVTLLDEAMLYKSINTQYGGRGRTVILDTSGKMMVYPRNEKIDELLLDKAAFGNVLSEKNYRHVAYQGESYVVVSNSVGGILPWTMVSFYHYEDMFDAILPIQRMAWLLLAGMLVVSFVVSVIISHTITKPLEALSLKMEAFATGNDRSPYFKYGYHDELGVLGDHFNRMVQRIEQLLAQLRQEKETVKIEQLLKRRAELKALQAQINPHFLYNTLDSISWMAIEADVPQISDMSVALAQLFRSGLNQGNDIVPLESEFLHAQNYLKIQKMRYEERFDYEIFLPEELKGLYTVKLILQPLVENAIYHGIKEAGRRGKIAVSAKQSGEKRIELVVSDDGKGFAAGEMKKINENLRQRLIVDKKGYGIFNVNERIKLYFGNDFGLRYERTDGITYARVFLPRVSVDEVSNYVEYFDRR